MIAESAYHALFMHNMLIRPQRQQLTEFGEPDVVILNAGSFPANPYTAQMTSTTSIDLSIECGELVILGTQYAGEMKKDVFTVMNYLMPTKRAQHALQRQHIAQRRCDLVLRSAGPA